MWRAWAALLSVYAPPIRRLPSYVTPEYLAALGGLLIRGAGDGLTPATSCSIQEQRRWERDAAREEIAELRARGETPSPELIAREDLDPRPDAAAPDVCPVIRSLVISAQDRRDEWRHEIAPLLVYLAGSRLDEAGTQARGLHCADWRMREVAPWSLDEVAGRPGVSEAHATQIHAWASRLRGLTPLVDTATAQVAVQAVEDIWNDAKGAFDAFNSVSDAHFRYVRSGRLFDQEPLDNSRHPLQRRERDKRDA